MTEFLTMVPAPAINPIMEVAVKYGTGHPMSSAQGKNSATKPGCLEGMGNAMIARHSVRRYAIAPANPKRFSVPEGTGRLLHERTSCAVDGRPYAVWPDVIGGAQFVAIQRGAL